VQVLFVVIAGLAFALSALGILLFFPLYPLGVWLVSRFAPRRTVSRSDARPPVSLLVVVRNAESFIADKVRNGLALHYPEDRLEIVVYSDGSTDATNRIVGAIDHSRLHFHASADHRGKIAALNAAMDHCRGEIVVFSDADARLDPDALIELIGHFDDPRVGGVSGRRVIARDRARLQEAQAGYVGLDSFLKGLESRIGSTTSNDGKLYAIRRELFHPIAPAVTDDLYVALDVVRQRRRFTFEPRARAFVPAPARSPAHEVRRRRRIVSQSLRGIYLMRETLNPLRHGGFAFALAINKVLRRLLPFSLLGLFASSLALSFALPWFAAVWLALAALCLAGGACGLTGGRGRDGRGLPARSAAWAYFFMLGQYGTLLGVLDFVSGRSVVKWDPVKTDDQAV